MASATRILVVNPNSSESITEGLKGPLEYSCPAGVELVYLTGPKSSPPSINDAPTSIQSAHAVYSLIQSSQILVKERIDAVLVCCFSDHPLVAMLQHKYPHIPSMHILQSAISMALSASPTAPFGIITTGRDMVNDIDRGVLSYLGGVSARYAGCIATNLGVLELRAEDNKGRTKLINVISGKAEQLGRKGTGAVILGCAGMAGMEDIVKIGLRESLGEQGAAQVAVIDGAVAGIHLLAGLTRCNFKALLKDRDSCNTAAYASVPKGTTTVQ